MLPGRFITFEGGEGSGKSTQADLLAARLRENGDDVVLTREPGGTAGAEQIRTLLVTGEPDRWDSISEALLLHAARRDHVERLIRPALARGATVICDRFIDSTLVYQGAVQGVDRAFLDILHQYATNSLWPDITLWLDIEVEIGLRRALHVSTQETRFEHHQTAFHAHVREGFAARAAQDPQRIKTIDANQTPAVVAAAVWQAVHP